MKTKDLIEIISVTASEKLLTGVSVTEAFSRALEGAATSGNKLAGFLSLSSKKITGMGSALSAITPALIAFGATVGVFALIERFSPAKVFERARDKANDAIGKYKETASEIESIESELASVNERISEIKAQGTLTLTDKAELENLETQSANLERTLELKRKIAEIDSNQAAMGAANALRNKGFAIETGTRTSGSGNYEEGTYRYADIVEYTQHQIDMLDETTAKLDELNKRKLELEATGDVDLSGFFRNRTSHEYESLLKEISSLEAEQGKITSGITENIGQIDSFYNTLLDDNGDVKKGYEDLAKSCEEVFDSVTDIGDRIASFKDMISGDDYSSALDDISGWSADELNKQIKLVARGSDEASSSLLSIVEAAEDSGAITTRFSSDIEAVIGTLRELGYVADETGVSLRKTDAVEEYLDELERFKKTGLDDVNKTKFGNIDLNNRQILEWTEDNLKKYRDILGEDLPSIGSYSTVLGTSGEYDGIEIAFSPMLQTSDGPKLLSQDTVDSYIWGLIDKASEDGSWTNDELFKLDAKGLEIDGQKIKKLIADIGDTAVQTAEAMHFLGKDGSLTTAYNDVKAEAGRYHMSVDDYIASLETQRQSAASLAEAYTRVSEAVGKYQTALSEQNGATGLSAESIANIKSMFSGLDGYNASTLFEETAVGVKLDSEELAKLNKEYDKKQVQQYSIALKQLEDEFDSLTSRINNCTDAQLQQDLITQRQSVIDEINDISMLASQYEGLTSAYNVWQQAQSGTDHGDMYDKITGGLKTTKKLYKKGLVGTNEFRSFVDLMTNADVSTMSAAEAVDVYEKKIKSISSYFNDGKKGAQKFLDKLVELGAATKEDGSYLLDFDDAELARQLDWDESLVTAMLDKLKAYGFEINFGSSNEQLDALQEKIQQTETELLQSGKAGEEAGKSIVKTLQDLGYASKDFAFEAPSMDIDTINAELTEAQRILDQFKVENEDGEIVFDTTLEGYPEAVALLDTILKKKQAVTAPAIMHVDTSLVDGEIGQILPKLQEFHDLANERARLSAEGMDTSAIDSALNQASAEIQNWASSSASRADILATLNIDTSGTAAQIDGAIANITPEIMCKAGVDESAITNWEAPEKTAIVQYDLKRTPALSSFMDKKQDRTANLTYGLNKTVGLTSFMSSNHDMTATMTYEIKTTGSPPSGGQGANGTAHVFGTVGDAHASGNWGVDRTQDALVNELGEETLVRDGMYHVIPGGAQFIHLKKGDILFNHEQTEELIKRGYVTSGGGRGKALYTGTGNAFNSRGSGRLNIGSSGKGSSSSGTSGGSGKSGNSGKSSGTALDAFKDWFSSLFDWIEVKLKRQTDNISDYIAKAELQTERGKYGSAAKYYEKAISGTTGKAETEAQAYKRYNQQANSVMNRAVTSGLLSSKDAANLKKLVANGKVDIKEYNEDVQEVIKSYQQWYDKAMESKYAITELHTAIQGYVADLKKVRDAQRDAKLDSIKTYTEIGNSTFGFSVGKKNDQLSYGNTQFASQNAAYSNAVSGVETDTKALRTSANSGIKSALKAAKKSKNKKYQAALKNAQAAIKNNKPVAAKDMDVIVKYSRAVYERIYAYNLGLENVETSKLEYAAIYATNSAETFGNIAGVYDNNNSKYESNISLYKQISANKASASDKNSVLNQAASQYDSIVSNRLAEVNRFVSSVNTNRGIIGGKYTGGNYKTLSQKDKSAVDKVVASAKSYANKNQPIPASVISALAKYYSKGYISAAFYNACVDYNNAVEYKAQSEAQLEIDKQTAIAEKAALGTERLSNVQKEYENSQRSNVQIGLNKATSVQNLKKARSQDLSEQDYRDLISYNAKEATIWANAQKATQKIVDENLKLGLWTTTSQEYLDAVAAVAEYGVKVDEANTTIEGLKDSLRDDVYWRTFERAHDAAERLSNILSGINDLIDDNSLFDKSGGLTDFGAARIAMLTKELANARSEVKNYSNDIANLNKLYGDGQYTEQEYKEKLNDIQTELLKSASSAKSYTDSLVDMYKQMAKAELDMLLDVIQARQDALKSKKDYYDYDKKLRSQTNDVQALQAQLAALEGIDTAEAKARMAKLSAELSDKQEDLDDMLRDHAFDLSNEALNKLKDTLQDAFDDKWDHISGDLSSITELISASNDLSATSAKDIQATLNKLLNFYGVDPVPTGVSASYASGTKKTPRGLIARTNENGPEIIVRKDGIITPLPAGSGVVPSNLTEKLYQMAEDYNPHASAAAHYVGMPKIESGAIGQTVVHQHYDSLINIEGSADAATVEDLKKMKSELLDESYKYTSQKIHSGYVKAGGMRKV